MDIINSLKQEFQEEAAITKKFLMLIPEDKYDWAPHEKSMSLKQLAVHIAELPSWVSMAVNTDGLDFATSNYAPTPIENNEKLLELFERSLKEGNIALENAQEDQFGLRWTLKSGETILWDGTKYSMIRHAFSQTTHHRAQLGVYLRLLNIPIPGSYGPSADNQNF